MTALPVRDHMCSAMQHEAVLTDSRPFSFRHCRISLASGFVLCALRAGVAQILGRLYPDRIQKFDLPRSKDVVEMTRIGTSKLHLILAAARTHDS